MNSTESKETREQTVQTNIAPLLRRVSMFLEDGDWQRADEYCEKVLDLDPENAEAYLDKLMAELHVRTREALKDQPEPFDTLSNYQKILRFGDEKLKQQLTADVVFIKDRYETAREEARIAKEKATKKSKKIIAIVMSIIFICIAFVIVLTKVIIPTRKYNAAIDLYKAGKYEDAIAAFTAMDGYRDSVAQIEKCKTAIKDEKYAAAVELYTAGRYVEAIAAFTAMDGYRDSAAQIEKCKTAIKDEKYAAAVELYIAGKYEEAIAAFAALDGYKDSVAKIDEIQHSFGWMKACSIGETLYFGSYEQDNNTANGKEDIEWIVLAKEGNKVLVISKYALDCQKYNSTDTDVTWETCSLRKWLNGTFLNAAFSSVEQNSIISSSVTSPGKNTTDKVFLLSITEVNKYFRSDNARQCQGTEYCYAQGAYKASNGNCLWWLRSPGDYSDYVAYVPSDGSVDDFGIYVDCGSLAVRPALWIDLG